MRLSKGQAGCFIQEGRIEWQIFQGRQQTGTPNISSSWEATKSKKNPLNLCPWVLKLYLKASIFLTKKVRAGRRGRAGTEPNVVMIFLKRILCFSCPPAFAQEKFKRKSVRSVEVSMPERHAGLWHHLCLHVPISVFMTLECEPLLRCLGGIFSCHWGEMKGNYM